MKVYQRSLLLSSLLMTSIAMPMKRGQQPDGEEGQSPAKRQKITKELQQPAVPQIVRLAWEGAAQEESIEVPFAVMQHSMTLKTLIEDQGNQEQAILIPYQNKETVEHAVACLKIIHNG